MEPGVETPGYYTCPLRGQKHQVTPKGSPRIARGFNPWSEWRHVHTLLQLAHVAQGHHRPRVDSARLLRRPAHACALRDQPPVPPRNRTALAGPVAPRLLATAAVP